MHIDLNRYCSLTLARFCFPILIIRFCPQFYSLFHGAVFAVMLIAFVICVLISLNDLWGVWE